MENKKVKSDNNQDISISETIKKQKEPAKKPKSGDSRKLTAIILLLTVIPLTIIDSLIWHGDQGLFGEIYVISYQVVLGGLVVAGILEAIEFIYPLEKNTQKNNVLFFPLLFLGLATYLSFVLNIFDISLFSNTLLWFLVSFVLFIIITSVTLVDFKDVLVSLFLVTSITLFAIAVTWMVKNGGWQVITLILSIAIISDTSSYFIGKKYGTTKAFPEISPNKTVLGLLSGILISLIFGWLFWLIFINLFGEETMINSSELDSYWMILIILFGSLVSPFGDLTFSKVKRSYNKKDFSDLLPGHGGIFDRLDSHIFVSIITTSLMTMIVTQS